jgi:hypothetical protein
MVTSMMDRLGVVAKKGTPIPNLHLAFPFHHDETSRSQKFVIVGDIFKGSHTVDLSDGRTECDHDLRQNLRPEEEHYLAT